MTRKSFVFLTALILSFINAIMAEEAAFRAVVIRNDKTVGGEFHIDLEFRQADGLEPKTLASLICDVNYGTELSAWITDPAVKWMLGSVEGYADSVIKNIGNYRVMIDGSNVNSKNINPCPGDPAGWNAASTWQKIVTLRWTITDPSSASISMADENNAASYFANLSNCPRGDTTGYFITNGPERTALADPCRASFTISSDQVDVGQTVTFTSDSDGALSYDWDFGDGTSATGYPVTHVYTTPGEIYATLTISCADGSSSTDTDLIVVNPPPPCTSSFTATPNRLNVGQIVTFASSSSGALSYEWDFGDGTTGNGNPVTHSYSSAGTMSATLKITCYENTDTSAPTEIIVDPGPSCLASFVASPEVVEVGQPVTFNSSSIGALSYEWDFGDGTSGSGEPITHTYTSEGAHYATLTITCTDGVTTTDTDVITVTPSPVCSALFTATPNPVDIGQLVTFTSTSTGAVSYLWDFGDGTTASSNPVTHAYTSSATFNAMLTITCANGSTSTDTTEIQVNQPPVCEAVFSATPNPVYAGQPVTFTSTSGNTLSFAWQFGDSTSASGNPAIHIYPTAGTFSATLTITCSLGTNTSAPIEIVVQQPPTCNASFAVTPEPACVGTALTFTGPEDAQSWDWNFGDGVTGTGRVIEHKYTSASATPYIVTLTTHCAYDGSANSSQQIIVSSAPTADFSAVPVSGTVPLNVTFTDLSSGNTTSWLWNFGDGDTSTIKNPSHTYSAAGVYAVTLSASNACGTSTAEKENFITVRPVEIIDYDYGNASLPSARHLYNQAVSIGNVITAENGPTDVSESDGLVLGDMIPGTNSSIKINVTQDGFISAWIDFDGNTGDWETTPPVNVIPPQSISGGIEASYTLSTPAGTPISGQRWIRIRYSIGQIADVATPESHADNAFGEVQDYLFSLLPVELASFTVASNQGVMRLEWRTQSETENLGFHMYRAESENGDYQQITPVMIPGAGTSASVHSYVFEDRNTTVDKTYFYKLADVDYNGRMRLHGPITMVASVPAGYALDQNYPNPFNPETRLSFSLKQPGFVNLTVFNLKGQKIRSLISKQLAAGMHSCNWNGKDDGEKIMPTGTYLYTLRVNGFEITRKMEFVK